jgi:tetratricopeptide (TPR) repeat protein
LIYFLGKKQTKMTEKSRGFGKPSPKEKTAAAQNAVQTALGYCQAGLFTEAVAVYRQILQTDPSHLEALINLGILCQQLGNSDAAEGWLHKATVVSPNCAEAHFNLGTVFGIQGKISEAMDSYHRALTVKPDYLEAHCSLNQLLLIQGKLQEAANGCEYALSFDKNSAEIHNLLGQIREAQGQLEAATQSFRTASVLKPNFAEAYSNLGRILEAQGCFQEAESRCRQALALKPQFAEAYYNLGTALLSQGRWGEATACYQHALTIRANFFEAYNSLGLVLAEQGQFAEALAVYQHVLQHKPNLAETHCQAALVLLLLGNFEAGWSEYEWRWQTAQFPHRTFSAPPWDGSSLQGKTILLYAEQGLGDMIQFVRYAPLIKSMGATVIVETFAPLISILSTCSGVDRLLPYGQPPPPIDTYAPLMSLPRVLSTRLYNIPTEIPYLHVPTEHIPDQHLQNQLTQEGSDFKVGLVWAAKSQHRLNHKRYCPLADLEPLIGIAGVQWFSLYKGDLVAELEPYQDRVNDLGSLFVDFADTAWAVEQLDLVITVDTAVAHLAGALGRPVWVLLPFIPDWRWLLDREDSPWYPTARLFRQKAPGDWSSAIEPAARLLRTLI